MSDLAVFADPGALDEAADPGAFVVLACERAKEWLAQAVEHGDIDQIVEIKSQAEAIRIYTTQKQLGKDAELSAAEIVRRAERGLGLAIRRGQEEGTIAKHGSALIPGAAHGLESPNGVYEQPSPSDYATRNELAGGGGPGIYAVTDDVDDASFDAAIAEGKAEGNLSRANIARKVGKMPTERPEHLRGMRHIDANRVIDQAILHSGIPESIAEQIDFSTLDRDRLEEWVISLSDVIRSLTTLKNNLKKEITL